MNEKKPFSIDTVDEFMESITLIQTRRASRFPVILVGSDYWKGLVEWMKETMAGTKKISESDLAIFRLVDDPATIVRMVQNCNRTE